MGLIKRVKDFNSFCSRTNQGKTFLKLVSEDIHNYFKYLKAKSISNKHDKMRDKEPLMISLGNGIGYLNPKKHYITREVINAKVDAIVYRPQFYEAIKDYVFFNHNKKSKKTA